MVSIAANASRTQDCPQDTCSLFQARIAKLEAQLHERDTQLAAAHQQIESLEDRLTARDTQLQERDTQLTTAHQQIKGLEDRLTARDTQLQERDTQLASAWLHIEDVTQERDAVLEENRAWRNDEQAELEEIISEQNETVSQLRAEISRYLGRIQGYETEKRYQRDLLHIPNTILEPQTKIALLAYREHVYQTKIDLHDETPISIEQITKAIGSSEKTMERHNRILIQMGLISIRTDPPTRHENGNYSTQSYITLSPSVDHPHTIRKDPSIPTHGGPRKKKCKKEACSSEDTENYTVTHCRDCHDTDFSIQPGQGNVTPIEEVKEHIALAYLSEHTQKHLAFGNDQESETQAEPSEEEEHEDPQHHQCSCQKQDAFGDDHLPPRIMHTLASLFSSYDVRYEPHRTCRCGCQLWRPVLGEPECCRCEPHPFWPDHYTEALQQLYPQEPSKKRDSHYHTGGPT